MIEVWKDIAGYEGRYRISSFGRVLSLNYRGFGVERILVPKCNNSGRLWVELYCNGERKPRLIHRLVASAFLANPGDLPQINHKDENPKNNRVENLEWCTGEYNRNYYLERHPQREGRPRILLSPVEQLNQRGEILRRWENSRQAAHELGFNQWSICECCRGNRKTAYGFKWRFAN